jgi:hypothetical protein
VFSLPSFLGCFLKVARSETKKFLGGQKKKEEEERCTAIVWEEGETAHKNEKERKDAKDRSPLASPPFLLLGAALFLVVLFGVDGVCRCRRRRRRDACSFLWVFKVGGVVFDADDDDDDDDCCCCC